MKSTNKIESEIVDFVRENDGITEYKLCQKFNCDKNVPQRLIKKGVLAVEKIRAEMGKPGFNGKFGYKKIYHVIGKEAT